MASKLPGNTLGSRGCPGGGGSRGASKYRQPPTEPSQPPWVPFWCMFWPWNNIYTSKIWFETIYKHEIDVEKRFSILLGFKTIDFDEFFFPKTTTDSERTRPRIKKMIIWLKSPINPLMIPKKFQSTNVAFVEISIHFDCHGIIEYQIFWSIFPIVQANLRQKTVKINCDKIVLD